MTLECRRDPGARRQCREQTLAPTQLSGSGKLHSAACSFLRSPSVQLSCKACPGTGCFGGSAPRAIAQPWPALRAAFQKHCSPAALLHLARSTVVLPLAEEVSSAHALGSRGAAPALLAGTRRAAPCAHTMWTRAPSLLLAHLLLGRPQLFPQLRGGYSRPCAGGGG